MAKRNYIPHLDFTIEIQMFSFVLFVALNISIVIVQKELAELEKIWEKINLLEKSLGYVASTSVSNEY